MGQSRSLAELRPVDHSKTPAKSPPDGSGAVARLGTTPSLSESVFHAIDYLLLKQ